MLMQTPIRNPKEHVSFFIIIYSRIKNVKTYLNELIIETRKDFYSVVKKGNPM